MEIRDSVIAVLLFGLLMPVLILPWIHRQYVRYGRLRGWSAALAATEVLYLCGLVAFTLFPLPTETAQFCATRTTADYLQVHPLAAVADIVRAGHGSLAASLGSAAMAQVLLNVVLFVPLGFLLRYRFARGPVSAVLLGFAVSLLIETTQGTAVFGAYACPYRLADVDDLITNTLGAAAGWLLAWAVARRLPAPVPTPVDDLAPPGLLRRGLAVAADLLIIGLIGTGIRALLAIVGDEAGMSALTALSQNRFFTVALAVAVAAEVTLLIPLRRRDHATLGQVTFGLAPAVTGTTAAAAIRRRFVIWWLPASLLAALDHTGLVLLAALVIGVIARTRPDRRSPLGLAAGTSTVTRAQLGAAAGPQPMAGKGS
jgi:glycopeptide antibiotics resistance protein